MSKKTPRTDLSPATARDSVPESYRTLGAFRSHEIVIKRSRFIGWGAPVANEEEALAVLETIRTRHAQATHNCYAYRVGFGTETVRFSDDGEPGGTAGKPILEVIQREDLRNVIIVVTRYFGGTLLGAGGLVRAYAQSAKLAVDAAGVVEQVRHARVALTVDYESLGRIQYELQERGVIIESAGYGENVSFSLLVRPRQLGGLVAALQELTSGKADPQVLEYVYRAVPVPRA